MRKKNTGKPSEKEFVDIFKKLGKKVFVHRIMDNAEVRGRVGGTGHVRAMPSDWIVTENGVMYYAETKSTMSKVSFKASSLTISQKAAARQQFAAGGLYFVFIHRLTTGDWYKVPADFLLMSGKTTFKWIEFQSYRWELAYA